MNLRAHLQFYKSIFPFILAFGCICFFAFGLLWGLLLYLTVALAFGFFGFFTFMRNQYYFYYNLGITQWSLFKNAFITNLIAAIPIAIVAVMITFLIKLFEVTRPTFGY